MSVKGIPIGDTNVQRGVWRRIDLRHDGESHSEIITCPNCAKQTLLNTPEHPEKTNIKPDGKMRFNCPWECGFDEQVQLADYEGAPVIRPQDKKGSKAAKQKEKAAKVTKKRAGKKSGK